MRRMTSLSASGATVPCDGHWHALPGPHTSVKLAWCASIHRIEYEAMGYPAELIACGAIEPGMELAGKAGRRRRDSHGCHFMRDRVVKYGPAAGMVKLRRRIQTLEQLRTLPGVPATFALPEIDALQADPDRVLTLPDWLYGDRFCYLATASVLLRQGLMTAAELAQAEHQAPRHDDWIVYHQDRTARWVVGGYLSLCDATIAAPREPNPRHAHLRLVVDNSRRAPWAK